MNQVCLSGRLTEDPEIKYTQSGKAVVGVSLAEKTRKKDEDGKYISQFHRLVFWENNADYVAQYFKKGDFVFVSGRIENRKRTNQSGFEFTATDIIVTDIELGRHKQEQGEAASAPPATPDADYDPFGEE